MSLTAPSITLRAAKESALSYTEIDGNFQALQGYSQEIANALLVSHNDTGEIIDRSVGSDKLKPGPIILCSDTSSAKNQLTIAPNPAVTSYTPGDMYLIIPNNSNDGPCTLSVGTLGSSPDIYKNGVALDEGDIVKDKMILVVFSGGAFHLLTRTDSGAMAYSVVLENKVTMSAAATFVDVLTKDALPSGTYSVMAQLLVLSTYYNGTTFHARIASVVDASTTYHSSTLSTVGTSPTRMGIIGVVTLASTGSIKIQVAVSNWSTSSTRTVECAVATSGGYASGNNATQMSVLRVA